MGAASTVSASTNLLSVSVKVGKDPIPTGNKQNVIVSVSDAKSNEKVAGAKVIGLVMKPTLYSAPSSLEIYIVFS
jgi:hypothetical protein